MCVRLCLCLSVCLCGVCVCMFVCVCGDKCVCGVCGVVCVCLSVGLSVLKDKKPISLERRPQKHQEAKRKYVSLKMAVKHGD